MDWSLVSYLQPLTAQLTTIRRNSISHSSSRVIGLSDSLLVCSLYEDMGTNSEPHVKLVRLPACQVLKIRGFAIFWGLWMLFKRLLKRFLSSKSKENGSVGSPPECLMGSSLGRHTYVKVKGIKLHYVEAGRTQDPLVVLLHGFPDLWISWRYQIPELSKYYRVIALDLKGFGDSDKPESRSSYEVTKIMEEIKELVFSLGYKRCILVGHGLGGQLGWYFLHHYPDIVSKFVAISSPHPNLYWESLSKKLPFNEKWIQFCQLPYLPEIQALENDLSIIDNVYEHLNNTIENKSFLSAYKYSFSRKEDWTGALNYYRTLALWRIEAVEGSLFVPTLLIIGNKEPRDFFEATVKSSDYLEKYSLKVVENASHYLHHERPTEVNKLLINFLRGQQPSNPERKVSSNGLVTRMFGAAVSTTLSYGNGVFDVVKKAKVPSALSY